MINQSIFIFIFILFADGIRYTTGNEIKYYNILNKFHEQQQQQKEEQKQQQQQQQQKEEQKQQQQQQHLK
jgi:acid phosphatase family membrane protein YuiD